jgi:hypothetical protein
MHAYARTTWQGSAYCRSVVVKKHVSSSSYDMHVSSSSYHMQVFLCVVLKSAKSRHAHGGGGVSEGEEGRRGGERGEAAAR